MSKGFELEDLPNAAAHLSGSRYSGTTVIGDEEIGYMRLRQVQVTAVYVRIWISPILVNASFWRPLKKNSTICNARQGEESVRITIDCAIQ
jgi:hypothetical protein